MAYNRFSKHLQSVVNFAGLGCFTSFIAFPCIRIDLITYCEHDPPQAVDRPLSFQVLFFLAHPKIGVCAWRGFRNTCNHIRKSNFFLHMTAPASDVCTHFINICTSFAARPTSCFNVRMNPGTLLTLPTQTLGAAFY